MILACAIIIVFTPLLFWKNDFNSFFLFSLLQEESNGASHMQVHRTSSDISLDKLISLCGQIYKLLSEKNSRDLRIAGQLFDACNILKENQLE